MSQFIKLLNTVMPPPAQPAPRQFDGLEYRWKSVVFRPAYFKFEAIALGVLLSYLALHFIGRFISAARAQTALKPYKELLDSQFAQTKPMVSSSPAQHLIYSSGRRNVLALHTTLKLLPLHDPMTLIADTVKSIIEPTHDVSEVLLFDFTLGRGETGRQGEGLGVWSIVDKGAMRETKANRWDLTFARLHDLASIPITHALFAEHSDVTDVVLKTPNVGFSELLTNPKANAVLKYFLVTDVPSRRPTRAMSPKLRSREIILACYKPKNAEQVEAVKAWVQVALNVADLMDRPNLLKPDVSRKFINTRKTVDLDLEKDFKVRQAEDQPAEETAEEKRLAKKRAERAQLSEKELKKVEELDKKREMRKMQKKQQAGAR